MMPCLLLSDDDFRIETELPEVDIHFPKTTTPLLTSSTLHVIYSPQLLQEATSTAQTELDANTPSRSCRW